MSPIASNVTGVLSFLTLIADIFLVAYIIVLFFRSSAFSQNIISIVGRNALLLSFLMAASAFIGSIVYSEIIGFAPCLLCWIQRIFLFPQVLLFGIALYKKDNGIFRYALPLSYLGGLVALYQSYVQLGGTSFTACTAVGAECSKIFFIEYGYITIPMMSLTVFVALILIGLSERFRKA